MRDVEADVNIRKLFVKSFDKLSKMPFDLSDWSSGGPLLLFEDENLLEILTMISLGLSRVESCTSNLIVKSTSQTNDDDILPANVRLGDLC